MLERDPRIKRSKLKLPILYLKEENRMNKSPTENQFTNDNLNKNSLQFIEALLSL